MDKAPDSPVSNQPPTARRAETVRALHGDRRVDGYAWMAGAGDAETMAYLTAERSYYDTATGHLRPLVSTLADEMSARVPLTDSSISHERVRFSYYTRTPSGSEYAQLCRRVVPTERTDQAAQPDESVLLDPARLVGGSSYVDLAFSLVSPDERLLAYAVDTTGDEVYTLRFRDLDSGTDLGDVIPRAYFTGAWSADSSTFFYTVHDEMYRPCEVRRHMLGTPVSEDALVLSEPDQRYELEVAASRSGDVITVLAGCRDTTEVWLVDAHRPADPPRVVEPRRKGVEYLCEHARAADGTHHLFIVTNDDAVEFRLMRAPLAQPGRTGWREVVSECVEERIYEATAFARHLVVTLRRDGILMARAYELTAGGELNVPGIDLAPEPVAGTLELAENERYAADEIHVVEQSYTVPRAWYAVSMSTGARRLLRRQDVPGYDTGEYVSERIMVPSGEVVVPVTVARRVSTPLDGSAPCLLYGYGAYESGFEPEFDAALPALLDRGVVWAHAHVRGGFEGGRRWWLDGRLGSKQHTFDDHLAVADHLAGGLVDGSRIVTRGLSAGGLLAGAVFSQRPDRWRGVIAEVPAVDILTSMLDPTIPLTAGDWDEWGDPRREPDYGWMRAYSPFDNIPPAGVRPDLLVTGAVHDPRVMVREPAKWTAELRWSDPDWSPRCAFRVELGVGAHTGPSGRYARLRYEAEVYAWALERLGLG
jgi:oligopeptidase B